MNKKFPSSFMATILATCLSPCHATAEVVFDDEPEMATAPEAPLAIAGCAFRVDRPHESTHFPGTVNVIGRIQCERPVEQIEMTLGLAFNGVEVAKSTFSSVGTDSLKGNVATQICINGTYNGAAVATITFPPGSIPQTSHGTAGSGDVAVTCKSAP